MTKRSPMKWMKGSDYKGQVSQWANDMEGKSNHKQRNDESRGKE